MRTSILAKLTCFAFLASAASLSALTACSDSASPSPTDAAAASDASVIPPDAAQPADGGDAGVDSGPLQVLGTLEAKQAGNLATTMKLGTVSIQDGSALYRPKPSGGGTLTVSLVEGSSKAPSREIEVTLYDDVGNIEPKEGFTADAPNVLALHKGRVETYQPDGKSWATAGDGEVVVESISASAVTITLKNIGQFGTAGGTDVFVLSGTITIPIAAQKATVSGTATFPFTNTQPEPITSEPLNSAAPDKAFTCSPTTMSDLEYPFIGKWRTLSCLDVQGGTTRNLRIAFPSGHLPHPGQSLPLNKFDRVQVFYFEGPPVLTEAQTEKLWQADQGTLVVQTRDWQHMTLQLQNARMQSESPSAKGLFDWNGTVTATLWMP